MTEQTPQDLLAAMTALLQKAGAPSAAPPSLGLGLNAPQPTATAIHGIAVPVKLQLPEGSLRVQVWLGPEAAASQAAFAAALDLVERTVGPLDVWSGSSGGGLGAGSRFSANSRFSRR